MADLAALSIDDFQPLQGTTLELVVPGEGTVAVRFSATRSLGGNPYPGARRRPFAVELTAEAPGSFPQQIVTLDHPELGPLELFVVPIGPAPGGLMRYEAVFT